MPLRGFPCGGLIPRVTPIPETNEGEPMMSQFHAGPDWCGDSRQAVTNCNVAAAHRGTEPRTRWLTSQVGTPNIGCAPLPLPLQRLGRRGRLPTHTDRICVADLEWSIKPWATASTPHLDDDGKNSVTSAGKAVWSFTVAGVFTTSPRKRRSLSRGLPNGGRAEPIGLETSSPAADRAIRDFGKCYVLV